ncbi:MAG: chemotaxis protein CheA [Pararhodobacter sp.]|nr:chemotaxis protein CheA [Pararhodobacter sp.]
MISDDFRESFFQECEDLLEAMNDGFRLMADDQHEIETVHAVFRAVHSIKGGAGAFGLDKLVDFAHHFETALDKLRSGKLDLDDDVLALFQRCGDHLADLVAAAREGAEMEEGIGSHLQAELDEAIGSTPQDEEIAPVEFQPMGLDMDLCLGPASPGRYKIDFAPEAELFRSGNEPALLFRALSRLGKLTVRIDTDALPKFTELDCTKPHLHWLLMLESAEPLDAITDTFEFVEGMCRLEITEDEALDVQNPDASTSLQDIIAQTDAPVDEPLRTAKQPQASSRNETNNRGSGATIRVDLERVDKLINLVGELVIKEAMLSQSISNIALPSENEVSVGLESLKQLAGEIQEGVMAIRAQPVKPMFQRMSRIVREAGIATGKRVRLVTQGEHTEVDKTVIERLVDPLTHMIRNAVDHGLEDTETRRSAGKPDEGTVILSAAHRSGRVMIDISDDGGGINRSKVRKIAEGKGLVSAEADLSPTEIDNLLFLPGFSSKEEVSALSGRGVGLDVARSEVQALGGRVSITSNPGEGTTFSISLPLTLAVLEGMVIEVADQTMVVPITAIQETLQPRTAEIHQIGQDGRVVVNRERLVPIVDLGEVFGFRPAPAVLDNHVLLLVETDNGRHCALIVDGIQDQRQVVIKSLESNYGHVNGVAAATILGDGRIALIIDPDGIIRDAAGQVGAELQFYSAGQCHA